MTRDYPEAVAHLLTLGEIEWNADWADYVALGIEPEHIPALIQLAVDEDLYTDDWDLPEPWATVHAWRALGQLRAEEAIPALITLLPRADEHLDELISEGLASVFARIGPATLPALRDYFTTATHGMWSRSASINALVALVQDFPDCRAAVVETLAAQLAHFAEQDRNLNALMVSALCVDLGAVEAAAVIEAAYAAGQVDLMVLGDWEDAQVYLGLLSERQTPAPNYMLTEHPETADMLHALDGLKQKLRSGLAIVPPEAESRQAQIEQQVREQTRHTRTQEKKARAKRKAAKKARRKNR
ncbi:MAG: DUF1186 domain-containing protein [Anaerolineae bacterium]|nr:DUF1186 domain-containing protein [Anaerolineae bacterium]